MKNLLSRIFITLILFGIGKIIYDAGAENQKKRNNNIIINIKKDSVDELKKIFNKIDES